MVPLFTAIANLKHAQSSIAQSANLTYLERARAQLCKIACFNAKMHTMNPQRKFHLVFSIVMGAMMVLLMTFVITLVNVGWGENFLRMWMKAFGIGYVVAVPMIYFVAPLARKLAARLLGVAG